MVTSALPCNFEYLRLRTRECGTCLGWKAAFVQGRYPVVTFRIPGADGRKVQKQFYVRHLVYELTTGKPPPRDQRRVIATSCGNDRCILHVVVKTKAALSTAAVKRGVFRTLTFRAKVAASRRHLLKLTDAGVDEIRAGGEPIGVLARKHGISTEHARRVRSGEARIDYSSPFAALHALGAAA